MKFKEAVEKAEKEQQLEKVKQDHYLNSGIAVIPPGSLKPNEWILTYYDEKTNKVIQVVVKGEEVKFKESATPIKPTKKPLEVENIKIDSDQALQKASQELSKKNKKMTQVIITIQDDEKPLWKVNFVTNKLTLITYVIDAATGRIEKEEEKTLFA